MSSQDENVLGFSVDYVNTINATNIDTEEMVEGIDTDEVFLSDERIHLIAQHIVDHHNTKTRDKKYNALFAVSSIQQLLKYYKQFRIVGKNN